MTGLSRSRMMVLPACGPSKIVNASPLKTSPESSTVCTAGRRNVSKCSTSVPVELEVAEVEPSFSYCRMKFASERWFASTSTSWKICT